MLYFDTRKSQKHPREISGPRIKGLSSREVFENRDFSRFLTFLEKALELNLLPPINYPENKRKKPTIREGELLMLPLSFLKVTEYLSYHQFISTESCQPYHE